MAGGTTRTVFAGGGVIPDRDQKGKFTSGNTARRVPPHYRSPIHVQAEIWMKEAACRGMAPGFFFAERREGAFYDQARQICAGCPVRTQCLDYALRTREKYGMWGGADPEERRILRLKRRKVTQR